MKYETKERILDIMWETVVYTVAFMFIVIVPWLYLADVLIWQPIKKAYYLLSNSSLFKSM